MRRSQLTVEITIANSNSEFYGTEGFYHGFQRSTDRYHGTTQQNPRECRQGRPQPERSPAGTSRDS